MDDWIEFHLGDRILLSMQSSHAPDRGDLLNMRKVTYRVIGRTYTVDYADSVRERKMVCIINLEQIP
jgi:hypothetical protein